MSATAKIQKLLPSLREIADQYVDEVAERGGDTNEAKARFIKKTGPHTRLSAQIADEWFEFIYMMDKKVPEAAPAPKKLQPPTDLEKEALKLERQARRLRLASQVDEAAERKANMDRAIEDVSAVLICSFLKLSIADYGKLGERQSAHAKTLVKAGHKGTELLGAAASNVEVRRALFG